MRIRHGGAHHGDGIPVKRQPVAAGDRTIFAGGPAVRSSLVAIGFLPKAAAPTLSEITD